MFTLLVETLWNTEDLCGGLQFLLEPLQMRIMVYQFCIHLNSAKNAAAIQIHVRFQGALCTLRSTKLLQVNNVGSPYFSNAFVWLSFSSWRVVNTYISTQGCWCVVFLDIIIFRDHCRTPAYENYNTTVFPNLHSSTGIDVERQKITDAVPTLPGKETCKNRKHKKVSRLWLATIRFNTNIFLEHLCVLWRHVCHI